MIHRRLLFAALLGSTAMLGAQAPNADPPTPPAPPSPSEAPASLGRNPSVTSLMESFGLSEAEASERIELQGEIIALTDRIQRDNDPAFASVYIQHQPVYRVVVSFADNKDRNAFLQDITPNLRRYVQLRVAKRSKTQAKASSATLRSALQGAGVRFIPAYQNETEKFVIEVETAAAADKLRPLVPASLAADVDFVVAPLPDPQAAPTGVQPGDWVAPGYGVYRDTTYAVPCTLAFTITYGASNTRGILTAGHCTEPKTYKFGTHWITFPSPPAYQNETGAYDYAIYDTTGLNSDYQLYYREVYDYPEFAASGWLHAKNLIRGYNQVNGMNVCKSGTVSGITCGTINNDAYEYRPGYWFIKVGHSKPHVLSSPGDSGAPWFLYTDPRSSVDITAAGIHTAGDGTGTAARAVYMPIDRALDHVSNVRFIFKP